MTLTQVDPMELEMQMRYARRILTLELNRLKATGSCAFGEMELLQSLDVLRDLERKGMRNFTDLDLIKLQRILLRVASLN